MQELEKLGIKVVIVGDCWECTSHKPNNNGYPCRHGGTLNRFVYRALIGTIPSGMQVLHTCDNRMCLNPAHLWLGTHADNHRDKVAKSRQARLAGIHNPRAKLTEQQVMAIRSDPAPIKKIAAAYGVCFQMISRIKRREAWRALEI